MIKERPKQENLYSDIKPEKKLPFVFIVEEESDQDRRREGVVVHIRDGGDTFTFSLDKDGDVQLHGDFTRLTGPKAKVMMGIARTELEKRQTARDLAELSGRLDSDPR